MTGEDYQQDQGKKSHLKVPSQETNVNDFLHMMDVATQIRKEEEEIGKQFNIQEKRAEIKKKILATAQVTGENLTEMQVDRAIDSFFSGLYSFQEPSRNFETRLAELYVDRTRLGRTYGIPTLWAAGIATVIGLSAWGISAGINYSHERKVETAVEKLYQEKSSLQNELSSLRSDASRLLNDPEFPNSAKLEEVITFAEKSFRSSDIFFNEFCSKGTADDDIDQENYLTAKQQIPAVEDVLQAIDDRLSSGKSLIELEDGLDSTKKSLDSLIAEVRSSKPQQVFLERAESAYANSLVTIKNRQLREAQRYAEQLRSVNTDAQQFIVLPGQLEQVYASVKSVAKEKEALEKAETIYQEGQSYLANVEVQKLSKTVSQLQDLDTRLSQEYTIRIVSREGVKSGIDRYYNGKFSGWYLVLEAIDSKGSVVPLPILNTENGQTETVKMWGEKVAETDPKIVKKMQRTGRYDHNNLLQKVVKDKLDDGIVNDNIVGKKEKGYLDYRLNNPEFSGVRITRW